MTDLDALGRRRARARAAYEKLTDEARTAALEALEGGAAEADVARRLRMDRMTIRKWRAQEANKV